ncbi:MULTISPECIES: AfsR/SARP family transcriptional regulator [Actinokineospora]|uniref:XRE family transcriptional regulator n=1 Tax=Actinokineospora fastidiosa TaxID=1816 RepID=A0A918G3I6_9PSEU|nr:MULTISPECIES: BTAD domain-containing putative transcriptional regulator [Actinokineospora]UVS76891.1 Regulatory protein AfsR [Actinokineospora sp. UTMC 2448]GGS15089.1 XRE family transcriptional regulator [Actinokineospora fastidiosa]
MTGPGWLGVLGPVEAVGPTGRAELHGARQRAVLGVLALHAGTVLSATRLVDVLWGDQPPRTAVKTLHSHVARLRTALAAAGFGGVLVTRGPGYILDVAPESVDAHRFAALVRAARGLAADRAAALLREAVGLWRGEPFADTPLADWGKHAVDDLAEQRLSAVEDLWDAELRLGGHDDAARELPRLLARHPLRERMAGLAMLALHRCGRHADALAVFDRVRRDLAESYGADPGPDLAALHTAILRRDPALDGEPAYLAAPAQLPAPVGHFTGRAAELSALDDVVAGAERPVVVITGAAGMGKTALAVQWAHRVAARFPDGQLYLDLAEQGPADALAHLLRSLDVPDDRVPADAAERAALYRSLLKARRCLVLVDNAGGVDDVLPLVPGAGASVLAVTSRATLAALGTRHAVRVVAVDALDHADSLALLARVLGDARVRREPVAAARLARLCGGMPLALRIIAARLQAAASATLAATAADLASAGRLDGLAIEGDSRTVGTVLASAYRPLSPADAAMFRMVGLAPGATVTAGAGAALCGIGTAQAADALAALASGHLLSPVGQDRYRAHDLTREFAAERVAAEVSAADRAAAVDRLLDWYLAVAEAANRVIDPRRDAVRPDPGFRPDRLPFPDDRHAALAFLNGERDNVLPVVRLARAHGRLDAAWQLTYLLTSYHDATGHWHLRTRVCAVAAEAAAALGDPRAEAETLRGLGVAYFMIRRFEDALATNRAALLAAQAAGDAAGEGHVHNNIANALAELRRFDEAVVAHERAVATCGAAGNALGRALAQRNLGHTYVRMGRAGLSLAPLTDALGTFADLGHDRLVAATLDTIGEARLQLGEHTAALAAVERAITISRDLGDQWLEWECLLDAGRVHLDRGAPGPAADHFASALQASRAVGDRHGEAAAIAHLGRAYLAAGRHTDARRELERAVVLRAGVPDEDEQAQLQAALAELHEVTAPGR